MIGINKDIIERKLMGKTLEISERPHMSIGNLTPNHIHHSKTTIKTKKLWKNYYQKKEIGVNQFQD